MADKGVYDPKVVAEELAGLRPVSDKYVRRSGHITLNMHALNLETRIAFAKEALAKVGKFKITKQKVLVKDANPKCLVKETIYIAFTGSVGKGDIIMRPPISDKLVGERAPGHQREAYDMENVAVDIDYPDPKVVSQLKRVMTYGLANYYFGHSTEEPNEEN